MRAILVLALSTAAGCSSDAKPAIDAGGTDANVVVDASPVLPDAPTLVQVVTCPATGAIPTVVTNGMAYDPMTTTIAVGDIVKFVMPGTHNVVPDRLLSTDDGMNVAFSATRCLKFTAAGNYNFKCGPHQFKGNVVVN